MTRRMSLPNRSMLAGLPLVVLIGLLAPLSAEAYPWMIRHGYNACASCHVDPSGGGMLSPYGRAQAELLVATKYGEGAEGEVSPTTGFLLGAVKLPDFLNLGLSFRGGALVNKAGPSTAVRPVQMASDLRAATQFGPVRAAASLGFAIRRALPAALTDRADNNLVSREHWIGLTNEEQSLLVRAGRIALPFGIRTPEHIQWVRERTRTDLNDQQQHGLSIAYATEKVRTEVMGILGNLQLHPSAYRERGYSGFVELSVAKNLAVGVSSLLAQARIDPVSGDEFLLRQAHGAFGRWAPFHKLVLMAELDLLVHKPQQRKGSYGHAALLQADYELIQGVHLIATAESLEDRGLQGRGGWLSAAWFISHWAELRVDGIVRELGTSAATNQVITVMSQLHLSF